MDLDDIVIKIDDTNLKEELRSCQYFLEDSQLERAKHKVINYAKENFNAKVVDENDDHFFNNLKWI